MKIDPSVLETVARRAVRRLRALTPSIIAEQQRVADFYFEEKVIPRKVDIRDAVPSSELLRAITPQRLGKF